VTAGDRSFPTVLARAWHGCVPVPLPPWVGGIVYPVSSKAARLRRRQAVRHKKEKRQRKSGRVPQHTRAERRRAAAERGRQREADQRRQERLRKGTRRVVVPTIAASFLFVPLTEVGIGHHSYPYLSAVALARSDNPDLPHIPESDGTYYSSLVAAGTARTNVLVGPVPSEIWNGSERYVRTGRTSSGTYSLAGRSGFELVPRPIGWEGTLHADRVYRSGGSHRVTRRN
jgi:hypothetical protein